MAPFRFRLTTLLRIREGERDECRSRLADAERAEEIVEARIEEIGAEIVAVRQEAVRLSRGGPVDVDQLMEAQRFELLLMADRQASQEQLKLIAAEVERRREAVVAADREVRILERLRETQRDRYNGEQLRQERKLLDEVATQGFLRTEK